MDPSMPRSIGIYDTQRFSLRRWTPMPMVDSALVYFGDSGAGPMLTSSLQQAGHGSSSSSSLYQQTNVPVEYSGSVSSANTLQQRATSVEASEDHEYHDAGLEEKWMNYQRQLGTVFQDVKDGSLESAAETLLSLSTWLLTQAADLGTCFRR